MMPDWPGRPWNFAALPPCAPRQAGVVVMPAPFEATVSYRSGTRLGPQAIIDASRNMELFEEETATEPHLAGIHTLDEPELPPDPQAALEVLEPICRQVLEAGQLLVTLGGEHTVSLAPIRAAKAVCGDSFSILQLDAHADLRDSYLGTPYSHACTMRRALDHAPVVPVGIRSYCAEEAAFMRLRGLNPISVSSVERGEAIQQILDRLLPRVYITIDLDALDPSIMPAVGTPEPGGLSWYATLSLLREVAARREIIGFDLVELCPLALSPVSDFTAAKLAYKLMAYILQSKRH
ncbi:MAG: agmatinase [Pseudomonadota bacterium]